MRFGRLKRRKEPLPALAPERLAKPARPPHPPGLYAPVGLRGGADERSSARSALNLAPLAGPAAAGRR